MLTYSQTTLFLIVFSCYLIQSHLTLRGETVNGKTHLLRYIPFHLFSVISWLLVTSLSLLAGRERGVPPC